MATISVTAHITWNAVYYRQVVAHTRARARGLRSACTARRNYYTERLVRGDNVFFMSNSRGRALPRAAIGIENICCRVFDRGASQSHTPLDLNNSNTV